MKNLKLYRLVGYVFLSAFVAFLVLEMNGVSGRPDVKTKLLLQNIRTHLAQKADEIMKERECESGLSLCKNLRSKEEEGEEGKSEEIPPPPKLLRGQHKPLITVRSKEVIQTLLPKAHKSLHRKFQKAGENERKFFHSLDTKKNSEMNKDSEEEEEEEDKKTEEKKEKKKEEKKKGEKKEEEKKEEEKKKEEKKKEEKKKEEKKKEEKKEAEKKKEEKKTTVKEEETPVWKTKNRREPAREPIRSEQKRRDTTDVKSPKPTRKDSKEEPPLESLKKTIKKKVKLEEEKMIVKADKARVKETKKPEKKKKEVTQTKRKEEEKSEEYPVEGVFLFPNFVFVLDRNVQRDTCGKHSQIYLKQLKKYEIWALMMYDASAKLSSGVLQGNTNQYGDFDECLSVNAVFKKSKNKGKGSPGIKGKYCLANIDLTTDSETRGLRLIQERGESLGFVRSTIHDPGHFIPRFSTINWGMCVPSSCLAEHLEKYLEMQLGRVTNATGLKYEVNVDEYNCVVKDDLKFEWRPQTLMTVLFYLAVLSISLYATYSDVKSKKSTFLEVERETPENLEISRESSSDSSLKGKINQMIMAFSLKKNVEKLLSDKNRGNIECINGLRSVFTVFLYLAHKTIPLAMTPFANRVVLTKISNQPATVFLRASIVYTDSFLLISGVLTAYGLAKDALEKREISWVRKSIARFVRLTPPLLAVVLFYAYVWDQLGSGPVWNPIVKRNSELCRQHLWKNLLYIQNLFHFEDMCAPQTHQLALDMQLSLLAPLFVHLMHAYDKIGIGVLQALFILSSILRYLTTSNNDLSVVVYHGMTVTQLYKTANLLYAQAFHRASPYILGTVVGYHLHKFEKAPKIPKILAALGWIAALIFGYYSLVSPSRSASRAYQYDVQEAAQYAALSPVAWSLALSWVIAACHLGLGGKLNEFLSQRMFLVFSRISYSVYLTQFLVFFYKIGVQKIPEMFTFAGSFNVTEFVVVIGVSVVVTLFFDIPTLEIKKIILDAKAPKAPLEVSVSESSDEGENIRNEDESGSEVVSREESQEITDELAESVEDEDDEEEEEEEEEEGTADAEENAEEEIDDDEMIEAVFEIPLRRSSRVHFSDEPENEERFKVEPEDSSQ